MLRMRVEIITKIIIHTTLNFRTIYLARLVKPHRKIQ
uniref:Uncharacterized protein n=1 Tax=Arundo donax TaxID=35708 RepID=A0A0A9G3Q8_ARUDO